MAFAPTQTRIQCPNCGTPIIAQVHRIVDVGQQPELKEALLSGRLNGFQCPACGLSGALQAPLLYHDAGKELFLVFIPMGLNLPADQEDRLVAEMTNAVINATPPAQRRGYMLKPPTRVISMQGLVEAVLEADGVSRETLQQRSEMIKLISTLAEFAYDDEKLKRMVDENKDKIGYDLLLMVTATIEAAARHHDQESVERYETLREKLIKFADLSRDQVPASSAEAIYDQLISLLRELPPERLEEAVAANRPLMDYGFFLHLTGKAEGAEGEEREQLERLRATLVKLTEEMDEEAKRAMERASNQLGEILRSPDMEAAVAERIDQLDEAFLVVLSANIQAAQEQQREDIVQTLTNLYRMVITMLQERLRPELKIVNQLLQSQDADERRRLISEALETYNPAGFLELVQAIADDVESQGVSESLVAALRRLEDEVQAAIEGNGAAPARKSGLIVTPDDAEPPSGEPPKIYIPGRDA